MARYNNIAYVARHEGSDAGHVPRYFIQHSENFFLCKVPTQCHNQPTTFQHYRNGKLVRTTSIWAYSGKNTILMHLFWYLYFLRFLIAYNITHTTIIVSSPLFLCMSSLSRLLLCNNYIFWIYDYFPNPKSTTRIHNAMAWFYNARMRTVLYLSPAIEQLYVRKNISKKHIRKVVAFGVLQQSAARNPRENTIGYIGNLLEGKGLYLLLEAAAAQQNLIVEIIGNGPLRILLEQRAKNLNIDKRVTFFGFIPYEKLSAITSAWTAGVALYEYGDLNYADYTDPGKIKLYIDLGIPVIMTAISAIHQEVAAARAGVIISYSAQEVVTAMQHIQANQSNFDTGARALKNKYLLEPHYKTAFEFLEHTP